RVFGWRDVARRHRLIEGPQRDREAVAHVDARLHSRFEFGHRAIGVREPSSDLDFEVRAPLMCVMRDSSKNVTRQQTHSDPVRVLKHNSVLHPQVEREAADIPAATARGTSDAFIVASSPFPLQTTVSTVAGRPGPTQLTAAPRRVRARRRTY